MSAITTKSSLVGNMAAPANLAENMIKGNLNAKPRAILDSATIGSNNTTGDIYLLAPLESNAVLSSLKLFNDALDTNGSPLVTLDIGIANGPDLFVDNGTTYKPFDVISATCFASASTVGQAAVTTGTELIGKFTASCSELMNQLWKRAGLVADPGRTLVLQVKINHVAVTAATTPVIVAHAVRLIP